jgi:hypothetical protein
VSRPAPEPGPAAAGPAAELARQFVTALSAATALCLVQQLLAHLPGLPGLPDHRRTSLLHGLVADLDALATVGTPPAG